MMENPKFWKMYFLLNMGFFQPVMLVWIGVYIPIFQGDDPIWLPGPKMHQGCLCLCSRVVAAGNVWSTEMAVQIRDQNSGAGEAPGHKFARQFAVQSVCLTVFLHVIKHCLNCLCRGLYSPVIWFYFKIVRILVTKHCNWHFTIVFTYPQDPCIVYFTCIYLKIKPDVGK